MRSSREITCVIPAFNRETLIGRALRSAIEQSHPPKEIIVVDDGSTDRTAEIARGFGESVRVISIKNGGGSIARNRGVEAAQTDWIAFLDSDDLWRPAHLEQFERAFESTKGCCDLYFSDMIRPSSAGVIRQFDLCDFSVDGPSMTIDDATPWVLRNRIPMMLQASVIRRSSFREAGGLWESMRRRHDTHFFIKFCIGRSACAIREPGTEMTDDDHASRLTNLMHGESEAYYRYSRLMWSDLLGQFREVDRTHGRRILYRSFISQWQLGVLRIRGGKPSGIIDLLRAFRCSPSLFRKSILRKRPSEEEFSSSSRNEENMV